MSKSLRRVKRHMDDLGLDIEVFKVETPTHTAAQAAECLGCCVDQIVKSVVFRGKDSGEAFLFLTAGGRRVDVARASDLTGDPLGKADATFIRAQTGFAIGGVSPFGHLKVIRTYIDPHLMAYSRIWAAAGTPHHMFEIAPLVLVENTGARLAPFSQ